MSKQLFVIIDYNLSRIADVKIMTRRAKEKHGLVTVLVRKSPGVADRCIADHVIDLDPLDPGFFDAAVMALSDLGDPVMILPFSDNAVATGAAVAERFKVCGDSAHLAHAAYSKIAYRRAEQEMLTAHPQANIEAPKWREVSTLSEVQAFALEAPQGFVIKPSCEGNNRGVVKVLPGDDCVAAFTEVAPYLGGGALCEALITLPEEYSFDGLGALSFITKKSSAQGRYPVEYGQTVPARLPDPVAASLRNAGQMANVIVGQARGPFHNEVKLDPVTLKTSVIEPNRRPAGMRIWHLAEKVYGINFFERWVDTMLGKGIEQTTMKACGTASIRMLAAPLKGWLSTAFDPKKVLEAILSRPTLKQLTHIHNLEWSDFDVTPKPGAYVYDLVDDNSKFIAQIVVYAPDDQTDVEEALNLFDKEWQDVVRPLIASGDLLKRGAL